MKAITRKYYAEKIDAWLGKETIIVLVGQRRVGKSFILKDFIQRHQEDFDANIIFVDKEKHAFGFIKTYEQLTEYISTHFINGKHNYILIDEIQDIDGWEHAIRSFRSEENTDIIITGSNSRMLSSDLSTLLSGRYHEIYVQSLSYTEFLLFHDLPDNDASLQAYLNYGGMPGLKVIGINEDEQIWEYLRSVFNTVMLKDVIERHRIRNIPFLNNLVAFLADSIGKLNSARSISNYMKSQKQDISTNVILDYTSYFAESYLLHEVKRYDIHGKRLFESNQKVYFGDIGLRNFIAGGERETDIEKVIENVVFQHLLRLGYKVYVGDLRAGEIDFVCQKPNAVKYIQVAYLIDSDETRKREFGRLQDIKDNYPKYVISLTPLVQQRDYEGITHVGLREFLTNGLP
ncbi:MAG: ATP-binding protein [Bacteroidaceae bacterium]|nr:ATP-binding protein [Bacteroidaceae bacterium]